MLAAADVGGLGLDHVLADGLNVAQEASEDVVAVDGGPACVFVRGADDILGGLVGPAQGGAGAIVHAHGSVQRFDRRAQQFFEEMVAVALHCLDQCDAAAEVALEVLLLGY